MPTVCADCRLRDCLGETKAPPAELMTCRFGVTHARIDDDRVVVGLVATDVPMTTKRARAVAKRNPSMRVRGTDVRAAVTAARKLGPGVVSDFQLATDEVMRLLRDDPEMHEALASKLRHDFDANLDQSHDFLQLVKLVRGHAETLLLQEHPRMDLAEAAEAEPNIGAIYFSTELMLIKMDALAFLREINLALGAASVFQLHPCVLKYVRIYDWQARQKSLRLRVVGASYGKVCLNSDAVGTVIQGLLDNLVKYAPAGSAATVGFVEDDDHIVVDFAGLGPKIEASEFTQIFLPGYRAAAARAIEQSGLGVGLATAKQISDALDLDLRVTQASEPDAKYSGRFATTFTIRVARTHR